MADTVLDGGAAVQILRLDSTAVTDMMYGFGGEWHINPAWSLVVEWERYEMNEWLDVPSIGVKFSF